MTPLEAAKILIFSPNHYDFRTQHSKKCKDSWEYIPNTNKMVELVYPLSRPKYGRCDVMTPLEAAKILIFSRNHYDFRSQHPKKCKDSWEYIPNTNKMVELVYPPI